MLKLMKYEFRKQMFSKLIILIGIGLLEIYYLIELFREDESGIVKAFGLFSIAMFICLFYVAFESINVFNKDLKTKQSYMLYMVPQTTYSIIGAKIIAAILQIFLTLFIFVGAIIINVVITFAKFKNFKELFDLIKKVTESIFQIEIDVPYFISMLIMLFVMWIFTVLLGMLAISLSTTFLANSKFRTPVSITLFIILYWGNIKLSNILIPDIVYEWSNWAEFLFTSGYLAIISLILYILTAWMLDKKVSV